MVLALFTLVPLAVGVAVGVTVRRWPWADLSAPRAAGRLGASVARPVARVTAAVTPDALTPDGLSSPAGKDRAVDPDEAPAADEADPGAAPKAVTAIGVSLALVLAIGGGITVGVLLLLLRRGSWLADVDRQVAIWAGANASDLASDVMRSLTDLGSTVGVLIAAAVVGTIAVRRAHSWKPLAFLAVLLIGQNLLYNGIKFAVDRARPDIDPLAYFAGPSFPSGHTTSAAAAYAGFALVLALGHRLSVRATLAGIGAGIGVLVGCSRVLLGVHWLSDVIAGLALGWGWFAVTTIAFGGRLLQFGYPAEVAGGTADVREQSVAADNQAAGRPAN